MTYLSSVWYLLVNNISTIAAIFGNMLVLLCFLRLRWKWWLYPGLVMITILTLLMVFMFSKVLFGVSIAHSVLLICLGYWNDILILITFRERFWSMVSLFFTLSILNRMFTFWGYLLYIPLNALTNRNLDIKVSITLVMIIMYGVISLVCWFALREKGCELIQTKLHRHNWILIVCITIFAKLTIEFCSNYAFEMNPYSDRKIIWAMTTICIFVLTVLVLYIYSTLTTTKHLELRAATDRLNFEKEAQQRYYESLFHNHEELRRMKHDMYGHLSTISRLLKEDKNNEALCYLDDLGDYAESHQKELYSDDPYLNAVVTNYVAIFRENDTLFEHDIQIGKMDLHHVELCLALNNAFQNALEASLKLPPKQRNVNLQVKTKQNRLLFRVTNRFEGELNIEDGLPNTTKKNDGHGYELISIRDAAESVGGFAICRVDGDMFVLDVAI